MQFLEQILKLFGFTEMSIVIGIFCLVIMLGNLFGGLMNSVMLAMGGPIKRRKLFDRMSFRACLFSEILLLVFAGYYHAIMIQSIAVVHIVYWSFTLLAAPVLAFIGSQITYLVYGDKIEKNYRMYKKLMQQKKANGKTGARRKARPPGNKSAKSFDPSST